MFLSKEAAVWARSLKRVTPRLRPSCTANDGIVLPWPQP